MQLLSPALPAAADPGMTDDDLDRRFGLIARAHELKEVTASLYLREVERRRLHDRFGYKNTVQYAERRHGMHRATAYRLMRAARACERSRVLREAFEAGRLAYSKVDVVAPMLRGTDADAEWVERACSLSRARLQSAVNEARGLETRNIEIRLVFAPSQVLVIEEAREKCSRVAGADLDHGDFFEYVSAEYLAQIVDESEAETNDDTSSTGETDRERDRRFRLDVLTRDGWRCISCDDRCHLTVDHILPRARFPRLRWDRRNGACLCAGCHRLKTEGFIELERLPDGKIRIIRAGEPDPLPPAPGSRKPAD